MSATLHAEEARPVSGAVVTRSSSRAKPSSKGPAPDDGEAARGGSTAQGPGDLSDRVVDARTELDLLESRIELLEGRLHAARVLEPDEPSSHVVSLGSHVTLQDLDDGLREEYLLVSSAESNPTEGRLSADSPVGRAILGHHRGDVVDARAPHRIRHIRISDLSAGARRR